MTFFFITFHWNAKRLWGNFSTEQNSEIGNWQVLARKSRGGGRGLSARGRRGQSHGRQTARCRAGFLADHGGGALPVPCRSSGRALAETVAATLGTVAESYSWRGPSGSLPEHWRSTGGALLELWWGLGGAKPYFGLNAWLNRTPPPPNRNARKCKPTICCDIGFLACRCNEVNEVLLRV